MITADPRSILSVGATLGEGPVWVARDAALWFVDIKAHRVHRYDPALDVGRSWAAPGQAGWILPSAETGLPAVSITKGPAFSPDGSILYHTDTLGKRIWRTDVAPDGSVGNTTLFARIEEDAGYPDGPTVDAEGCLWTGLFGGWAVRRYDPAGKLMREIRFPVANVTKIAFGGEDLRTAYATTARKGLDMTALTKQPLAGDLFAFDPGVAGLPGHVATI